MTHAQPTTLTVVTGPMFAEKSGHLIAAANRFAYAHIPKERIIVAKPVLDTRSDRIATRRLRNGESVEVDWIDAVGIRNREHFLHLTAGYAYVALILDEAQFFPRWIGSAMRDLLHRRRDSSLQVIVAGLDTTSDGKPFGSMGDLLAMADTVLKLKGVCMACGQDEGVRSQNMAGDPAAIRIGDIGKYEVRCRACFQPT